MKNTGGSGHRFGLLILLKQFNSFAILKSFMPCIAVVKFSNGQRNLNQVFLWVVKVMFGRQAS